MPTAYIKKLAKLNHTTVNRIEKFWSQAKEIAKSEGNGKAWGLITSIFQNKLKKEGYKVKAMTCACLNSPESTKQFYEDLENELKAHRKEETMKPYSYNGRIIIASSKQEAIKKIVAYTFGNRTVEDVKRYLKKYSPIENKYFSNIYLYKKEITRLLKEDGQFTIIADKRKLSGLCHLCAEAGVSAYDAFKYISNNS